eukprot:86673-Rhodomonas_salina.1
MAYPIETGAVESTSLLLAQNSPPSLACEGESPSVMRCEQAVETHWHSGTILGGVGAGQPILIPRAETGS